MIIVVRNCGLERLLHRLSIPLGNGFLAQVSQAPDKIGRRSDRARQ
jgi:hypothetical protein